MPMARNTSRKYEFKIRMTRRIMNELRRILAEATAPSLRYLSRMKKTAKTSIRTAERPSNTRIRANQNTATFHVKSKSMLRVRVTNEFYPLLST
jgi:hypothetical protein